MRITHIYYDDHFEHRYRKIPRRVKELAKTREILFRENPFNQQLKTHKLHGREKEAWSFSIAYHYRITFIFLEKNSVLFLDIGTHNQVY